MSEYLAAAVSTMNVPEALVRRSAEARAKAAGTSVDEILQAWAGGESAPAAVAAPAPASQTIEEPTPAAERPVAPAEEAAAPAAEPAPAPAAVAAAVVEEPEEEPVEAAPLRVRMRAGGRIGVGFGLLAAVFVLMFSAQWLLTRAGTVPSDDGSVTLGISISSDAFIAGSALIGLAVGAAGAGFVRLVSGWRRPGMRLISSHGSSIAAGAVGGLLTGVLLGAVVTGAGVADPLDDAVTVVPLVPAMLWTLLGWIGGGWLIGAVVQAVGVPGGLREDEAQEESTVRARLVGGFGLPVFAALSILVLVLPAAWVFIQFPEWAPLIGIFIAGGILAFSGLSAARPGMRVSMGEFLVAVAGIGVVVLIVVAVLQTQGAGHDEEETHSETPPSEAAVVLAFS